MKDSKVTAKVDVKPESADELIQENDYLLPLLHQDSSYVTILESNL